MFCLAIEFELFLTKLKFSYEPINRRQTNFFAPDKMCKFHTTMNRNENNHSSVCFGGEKISSKKLPKGLY